MSKITLLAEKLYIIRSTMTMKSGEVRVCYYVSRRQWSTSPMSATLFQQFEAGEFHLEEYSRKMKEFAPLGWADSRSEVLDVVPLYGELLQTPNATRIEVIRDRGDTPDEQPESDHPR